MSQKEDIMTKGTITRTILLALAIINQLLTATGHNPLPADNDTVSTLVTAVVAILAWWKNNSFTKHAKDADEYMRKAKEANKYPHRFIDNEYTEGGE